MLNKDFILEQIEKHCTLDTRLCEETFYSMVVEPLECSDLGEFDYDSGATKGVLVFDELDYVIKIPFYCEYYEGYSDWDDETEEWVEVEEGGPSEEPFSGVEVEGFVHHNPWDYCETEQYRYQVAERYGVEEYFAKTWFLGKVNGWPIYAQVKANMFCSQSSYESRSKREYSEKEKESANTVKKSTGFYLDTEWVIDFLNYFNEAKYIALANFCEEWDIEDLHNGNIGYVNGAPCIVDYSSYEC